MLEEAWSEVEPFFGNKISSTGLLSLLSTLEAATLDQKDHESKRLPLPSWLLPQSQQPSFQLCCVSSQLYHRHLDFHLPAQQQANYWPEVLSVRQVPRHKRVRTRYCTTYCRRGPKPNKSNFFSEWCPVQACSRRPWPGTHIDVDSIYASADFS